MTNSGSDIITILKEQKIGLTVGVSLLLFVSYLFMAYIIYKPWKGPARSPPRSPVL